MATDLTIAGIATDLHGDIADLAHACCADGMTFRFQASAGVDGKTAVDGTATCRGKRSAFAFLDESEIFAGDDFGNRKTIVELGEFDVFRAESGHCVGFLAGGLDGREAGNVVFAVKGNVIGCLRNAQHAHVA